MLRQLIRGALDTRLREYDVGEIYTGPVILAQARIHAEAI